MDLIKYLESRIKQPELKTTTNYPFITISRETGCGAVNIVKLLLKELNTEKQDWKYIDKNVLIDSAKKLKIDKSKIKDVFEAKTKTHADEILNALSSKYYKSNKAVKKTITDVVKHFAEDGRVVLVGRAGAAITGHMEKGMHIRLIAPVNWRVDSLVKRFNKSQSEAELYVKDNDSKRQKLMAYFCDTKPNNMCFDLTINCAKFSSEQIVELILGVMEKKKKL